MREGCRSALFEQSCKNGENVKELRNREKAIAEQAERAYEQLVAGWRQKSSKRHTGPATAAGSSG